MNRLAREKSPYLLQHADNPVEWYPWGDEAFEAARSQDKPIFLSVGYSTCHWCHVMAHESFESRAVAEVLNEHFVSIKVDREERPDVDRVYMAFVQATTGGGGWPMSVWLTPDREPFYGGTYFPPVSRWGRPGFVDILRELARLWRDERARVLQAAAGVGEQVARLAVLEPGNVVPGTDTLSRAVAEFSRAFDERFGGFGGGPKFPRPSELLFLLREFKRVGDRHALEMVTATLQAMADGGMRDHIGGGFHRYSVDGQWRVPHFEKMLYDQAQLVLAYLEAAQAADDRALVEVAADTLGYVQRDLTDAAGGFYSAEDADSLPPDHPAGVDAHEAEGAFYLWTAEEIDRLLGERSTAFRLRYGVRDGGNALQDPQGEFTGRNILYVARSVDDVASEVGTTPADVEAGFAEGRQTLFEARRSRPRPHLDDKILTAWNGLMIGAFARAARVVRAFDVEGRPGATDSASVRATSYLGTAQRAAGFIRARLWNGETRTLLRRYRDGEAAVDAYAEDYACLAFGLLELFEADANPDWFDWAVELQHCLDDLFWDEQGGGWFSTTGADRSVRLRLKEDYDGAEPAASSMAALNALKLAQLHEEGAVVERVERTLRLFATRLTTAGRAVPMMLSVLSAYHAGGQQVVILGAGAGDGFEALASAVDRAFAPFATHLRSPDASTRARLATHFPFIEPMRPVSGRATAFVCRQFACEAPTTDPDAAARAL